MQSGKHARWYELSSRAILWPMRLAYIRAKLTWFSKVWLRQARIFEHLRRGDYDAIVDGGASIGEFAAIARLSRPMTPLLCVEPHPPSAEILRRRGFHVVEAALWSESGTACLVQPADAETSCTLLAGDVLSKQMWTVRTLRFDELDAIGERIFVKLDLQGAETAALAGLGTFWERCEAFLLEVSYGPQGTYEPIRALLAQKGFYEAATLNELEEDGIPVEADKLWLRAIFTSPT